MHGTGYYGHVDIGIGRVGRQRLVFQKDHVHIVNVVILDDRLDHMFCTGAHFVYFFNH